MADPFDPVTDPQNPQDGSSYIDRLRSAGSPAPIVTSANPSPANSSPEAPALPLSGRKRSASTKLSLASPKESVSHDSAPNDSASTESASSSATQSSAFSGMLWSMVTRPFSSGGHVPTAFLGLGAPLPGSKPVPPSPGVSTTGASGAQSSTPTAAPQTSLSLSPEYRSYMEGRAEARYGGGVVSQNAMQPPAALTSAGAGNAGMTQTSVQQAPALPWYESLVREPKQVLMSAITKGLNPYGIMDIRPKFTAEDAAEMQRLEAKTNRTDEESKRLFGLKQKAVSAGYDRQKLLDVASLPQELQTEASQPVSVNEPQTAAGKFVANQAGGFLRMGIETAGNFNPAGFAAQSLISSAMPYTTGEKNASDLASDLPQAALKAGAAAAVGSVFEAAPAEASNVLSASAMVGSAMAAQTSIDASANGGQATPAELGEAAITGAVLGAAGKAGHAQNAAEALKGLQAIDISELTGTKRNFDASSIPVLSALDGKLADLGVDARATSGRRHWSMRSNHETGRAIDIVVPSGDMERVAEELRSSGFKANFEHKGQVNANGSRATGDHIHVDLLHLPEGYKPKAAENTGQVVENKGVADTAPPVAPEMPTPDQLANNAQDAAAQSFTEYTSSIDLSSAPQDIAIESVNAPENVVRVSRSDINLGDHQPYQSGQYVTDEPLVEHVKQSGPNAGGVMQGVVARDLGSIEQARAIDPYAFAKDGGFFIHAEHVVRPEELGATSISEQGEQNAAQTGQLTGDDFGEYTNGDSGGTSAPSGGSDRVIGSEADSRTDSRADSGPIIGGIPAEASAETEEERLSEAVGQSLVAPETATTEDAAASLEMPQDTSQPGALPKPATWLTEGDWVDAHTPRGIMRHHMIVDQETVGGERYYRLDGSDGWYPESWLQHLSIPRGDVEEDAKPKAMTNAEIAQSIAPATATEAALQYIANGGAFHIEDVRRDVLGSNLKIGGRNADYPNAYRKLVNDNGVRIDYFVHNMLPNLVEGDVDELAARDEVHEVLRTTKTPAEARKRLGELYRESVDFDFAEPGIPSGTASSDDDGQSGSSPEPERSAFRGSGRFYSSLPGVPQVVDALERAGEDYGREMESRSAVEQPVVDQARAFTEQLRQREVATSPQPEADASGAETPAPSEPEQIPASSAERPDSSEAAGSAAQPSVSETFTAVQPETPKNRVTGVKHALTDTERKMFGLDPRLESVKLEDQEAWHRAVGRIEEDPHAGRRLVDELTKNPRALSPEDTVLLLHEKVSRERTFRRLVDRVNAPETDESRVEDSVRLAAARDELQQVYDVAASTGTEAGRSLRARRLLMNTSDYTLAEMEQMKRAVANDGEPLSDAQIAEVRGQFEAKEAAKAAMERADDEEAQARVLDTYRSMLREMTGELRQAKRTGKRYVEFADEQARRAMERIRSRQGRLLAGLPVEDIVDYGIIGAAKIAHGLSDFADWSRSMVADLGEKVRPHLEKIFEQAKFEHDAKQEAWDALDTGDVTEKTARAARGFKDKSSGEIAEIARGKALQGEELDPSLVFALARAHVEEGVEGVDNVMSAVHADLSPSYPGLTVRQVRDTFSGYGQVRYPSRDLVLKKLRKYRTLSQLLSSEEDVRSGTAPKRTGMQRDKPDAEVRDQRRKVQRLLQELGIEAVDPAEQQRTSLDAAKTRMRNAIEDLNRAIVTGDRMMRKKNSVPYDEEAMSLKRDLEAMKARYDEAFGKPEITDAQRVKIAMAAVDRSIGEYEKRIAEGQRTGKFLTPKRESRTPETPELAARRKLRDDLKDVYRSLQEAAHPKKTADERTIERLEQQRAYYQDKLERGDYTPRPTKERAALSERAQQAKIDYERTRQQFEVALNRDRLAKRSGLRRAADQYLKWFRAGVISSPLILAKLVVAATSTLGATPLEEVAGLPLRGTRLAELAPRHGGGFNAEIEAKAFVSMFRQGMKDAAHNLRNRPTDLEVLYDSRHALVPRDFTDYMGSLHGALKSPVKRAEFERSLAKRTEHAIRTGVDVTEPLIQMRLGMEAYHDAERAVFQNSNFISDAYNMMLRSMENSKIAPNAGPAMASAARFLIPITKVPVNIAGAALEMSPAGFAAGALRAARAYAKGIESLSPEEADTIMRELKKGSLGTALFFLGYFKPQVAGGFHQRGEKRDATDVPAEGIHIGETTIPGWLVGHTPLSISVQLGATMRRVADKTVDGEREGFGRGLVASLIGLGGSLPYLTTMDAVSKAKESPKAGEAFAAEEARSAVVPQAIQNLARALDKEKDALGNPVKRKPETFLQHIEMGVPFLRSSVPVNDKAEKQIASQAVESAYRAAWQNGDRKAAEAESIADKAGLTSEERTRLAREARMSPAELAFSRLPVEQAAEQYKSSSPEDRRAFQPILEDKIGRATDLSPAKRIAMSKDLGLRPPMISPRARENAMKKNAMIAGEGRLGYIQMEAERRSHPSARSAFRRR